MKKNITLLATLSMMAFAVISCKKDKDGPTEPDTDTAPRVITIDSLKSLYKNTAVTLDNHIMIRGIVISDIDNGNMASNEMVIQEGDNKGGILLQLTKEHTFKFGDAVEVAVSKQKLDTVDGELAIRSLAVDSIEKTGTGAIKPRVVTVKQVLDNKKAWDGTLVTIENGVFSNNEIFFPAADYTDATGTLVTKTLATASFGFKPTPYHEAKLTGIVRNRKDAVSVDMVNWYITFFETTDYKAPYTITEDFQQSPTGQAMVSNPVLRTGVWHYNVVDVHPRAGIQDGSYSTRAKIARLGSGGYVTIPALKGLKTITIVFAGSLTDTVQSYNLTEVFPYNATRDDAGIKINTSYYSNMIVSPTYKVKEPGKFNTVTYLIKKEDLATMDIDLDAGGEILRVENGSSNTRKNLGTSVVIDKVILGFDQKDPGINAAYWDN